MTIRLTSSLLNTLTRSLTHTIGLTLVTTLSRPSRAEYFW